MIDHCLLCKKKLEIHSGHRIICFDNEAQYWCLNPECMHFSEIYDYKERNFGIVINIISHKITAYVIYYNGRVIEAWDEIPERGIAKKSIMSHNNQQEISMDIFLPLEENNIPKIFDKLQLFLTFL